MRFKVERYTLEEGEIEADNRLDAHMLLRYGHGPISWVTVGKPTIKLKDDKPHDINSSSKRSN